MLPNVPYKSKWQQPAIFHKDPKGGSDTELYKRFIIVAAAVSCAAAAVCGVLIAKDNTERRLYGTGGRAVTEGTVSLPLPFPSEDNPR